MFYCVYTNLIKSVFKTLLVPQGFDARQQILTSLPHPVIVVDGGLFGTDKARAGRFKLVPTKEIGEHIVQLHYNKPWRQRMGPGALSNYKCRSSFLN